MTSLLDDRLVINAAFLYFRLWFEFFGKSEICKKAGLLLCIFSFFRPGKPTKKLLVKCWRNQQENEFESLLQGVEEKRGEEVAVVVVDVVAAVVKLLLF